MKKMLMAGFMVAMLANGVMNVSAVDDGDNKEEPSSGITAKISKLIPTVSWESSQNLASKHKWCIFGTTALAVGVYFMNKTCPWFRRLIGCEEDNTPKRVRRLDPRVTNPMPNRDY